MDDRWLWGALGAVVLIVVWVMLEGGPKHQPATELEPTRRPTSAYAGSYQETYGGARSNGVLVPTALPLVDAVGVHDLDAVPRYPGSKAIRSSSKGPLGFSSIRYITTDTPWDVGLYYAEYYVDHGYNVDEADWLDPGGSGWWGNFTSEDAQTSIAVFAISEWIDIPVGGDDNPTTIVVTKVSGDDLDVEALVELANP